MKKLSDATSKLWKYPNYVSKQSENHRLAVSSLEYKENMSNKMKEVLKSPELLKKWSDVKKGKNNNRWRGYMYVIEPNGNVTRYDTSSIAGKTLEVNPHTLIQHAINKNNISER